MTSLEGWGSAIELRPRARRPIPSGEHRQRTRTKGSAPNHYGRCARQRAAVTGAREAPRRAPCDGGWGLRGGRLRNGSAGCGAAWLARLLWEQEAAGSNPAIPTSSEHISILEWLSMGAKPGAMCYRAEHAGQEEARVRRGLDLLRSHV